MLDYKLIQALASVIEKGGFERAGDALGLTQSAVSQRIKSLEVRLGQPVITRHPELRPTAAGQKLLNHFQQVQLLERDLARNIPALAEQTSRLRIAINADTVATWWASVVADFCRTENILLDLVIEDQDVGLRRMREGDVAACLCSSPQPVAGARAVPLGTIIYRPFATDQYIRRYFPDGIHADALAEAPAIIYGPNDQLQHKFLAGFGYNGSFRYHLCPSSEGFIRFALAGIGYGMIPEIQARYWLNQGLLVDLAPDHALRVPLYWHFWRHSGDTLKSLTGLLENNAKRIQQWTI